MVFQTRNEKATEAPYRISYHISLAGETQMRAQRLIQPCALDITEHLLDGKSQRFQLPTIE